MNPKVITKRQLAGLLPKRPHDCHKGMFGTVTVIGGASGMVGAALLAGRAALKLGAGCVHVCLLADNTPAVDCVQPELMLHRASELPAADVIAIGCGLGTSTLACELLKTALHSDAELVIDADALNLLANNPDLQSILTAREATTLLTPHPGEAARLLRRTSAEIQDDRIAAVQQIAKLFSCPVVLKGADSLCVTRNRLFVNRTGNPGMSAPGMGDVLTGMIAALIAQGVQADDALLFAVHLHGAAGDELAKRGIATGMTASELADQGRQLLNLWVSQ